MNEEVRIYRGGARAMRISVVAGAVGLALLAPGAVVDPRQAAFSYLMAYAYTLSLTLGALLFLMIQRTIDAAWSIVLHRPAEAVAGTLPLLTLLFVPVLFGWPQLFPWLGDVATTTGADAGRDRAYLALPFAAIRAAAYFAIWNAIAYSVRRWSIRQETGGDAVALAHRQRVLCALGLPPVAFALTFAAFDWLMSLSHGWYSTIFGVYYFAGAMVGFLSLLAGIALKLERQGDLAGVVTVSHYHALGKLLFTFVVFWAYIAFSQLLLIWIADIPEEAAWFATRSAGSWGAVSALLVFGHFLVPFFALLSRRLKRRPAALVSVGVWLLVMHHVDIYWVVLPALHPTGVQSHWLDAAALLGVGGVTTAFALWRYRGKPVVASGDPNFRRSLSFFTT